MNFLRNFLASILGSLFAFGILFVMFLIFISLVGASEDEASVKKNSVLELQLQRPISDYTGTNEVDPFAGIFEQSQGLDEIIHAIEVAKNDERIKGISINNNFIIAGLAQTQAIRKSLEDFKSAGKFIYAYADFYMQRDYYLASVADSVFINPVGVLDFKGLSTEVLYYKDLQEKSGIKMEVIRHGKYKSAVEPYLENSMSEDNRTQLSELLHSLWNSMVTDISRNRSITESDLNIIADTLGGRTPEYAIKSGLIDDILFYDEYEGKLSNALGVTTNKDINYSTLDEYVKYSNKKILKKGDDKIAIVFAQGEIFYGEGGPDIIGQGIINEAIIKAREDKKVKAVVLRVNSPGGSALTSDIIWREVALTKEVKPVVVSMGNVAASGGYYIAAGADKIFAEPTTITGSIGVFGTIPNLTELAGDIGINAEQVGTNVNAIDYSLFEPMKESFKNQVQESIEDTYQTFLERVSQGRNLTMAQVDSVAQGRVWSGTEAVEVGLVDELGNLDDAIKAAAEIAGLETYGVRKFPKYKSGFERFMEDLEGASVQFKETLIKKEIGDEAFMILKEVVQLKNSLEALIPIKQLATASKNEALALTGDKIQSCDLLRAKIKEMLSEDAPANLLKGSTIAPGFSEELDELRNLATSGKNYLKSMLERETAATGITSLKIASNNVFGYYIEVRNTHKDKVPETWTRKQTLVNAERYITEELKEYEAKILGAEDRILSLEQQLFSQLVVWMQEYITPVQNNAQLIAHLDCLCGFAQLAKENAYNCPELNDSMDLKITNGRHPVIEKQLPLGEQYIANDLFLDRSNQQFIMITGPNMSGKSALLRQTALIVLLAQMGSFVPAENAQIGVVDKIFTRVGASDNISMGESTFMVEMNETASILNNLSERSLVLLDEIGRGTSTYDGISIAWAISEYLHEHPARAKTMFATHYHELNEMTNTFPRIKNFNVAIKELKDTVLFLRKLVPGGSEHSFGIHVAKMAGMPQQVIQKANKILKKLESSHANGEMGEQLKNTSDEMQLSFFNLDDPLLEEIKEEITHLDIDTLTPVEALMKLNEIKRLLTKNKKATS